MYTRKEKEIAIELYLKNNKNATKTVWELGYPSVPTLIEWYRKQTKKNYPKKKKEKRIRRVYSEEEIQKAVDYYLENGCNVRRTVRIRIWKSYGIIKMVKRKSSRESQ